MNELSAETSSEKLVLLLDGELSPSQEVPLFSDLASSDELRSEMRELISIKNIVKNDSEAFVPPFAATAGVFSSAGFSFPGLISSVGIVLLKYSWIPILLAVITGLTTYSILDSKFGNDLQSVNIEKSSLQKELSNSRNQIDGLQNQNIALQEQLKNKPNTVIKYIKVPVIQSVEGESKISEVEIKTTNNNPPLWSNDLAYSRADYNSFSSNPVVLMSNSNNPANSGQLPATRYQPMANNIRIKDDVYYLTFSGLSSLAFPSVNAPTRTASFSNFALGFYFLSPYKNIIIGGEFGKEPYSQSFINIENKKRFIYEQQPNIWWAGASVIGTMNYKINDLFGAQPYGKIFIGASELGPIGKAGAGLKWVSSSLGLGAFLGVEGSLLGYQNQGVWYSSGKIGFTYGLSIQF